MVGVGFPLVASFFLGAMGMGPSNFQICAAFVLCVTCYIEKKGEGKGEEK